MGVSRNQRLQHGPQILGLFLDGHPRKGRLISRNSHIDLNTHLGPTHLQPPRAVLDCSTEIHGFQPTIQGICVLLGTSEAGFVSTIFYRPQSQPSSSRKSKLGPRIKIQYCAGSLASQVLQGLYKERPRSLNASIHDDSGGGAALQGTYRSQK